MKKLKELLNEVRPITGYKESIKNKTVYFEIDDYEFNVQELFKFSDILGTGQISVEHYDSSGCSTCDYGGEHKFEFYATNVNFPAIKL